MLPKDLLDDLEKGDRTMEMLKYNNPGNNYHMAIDLGASSFLISAQMAFANPNSGIFGGTGQAMGGLR